MTQPEKQMVRGHKKKRLWRQVLQEDQEEAGGRPDLAMMYW